MWLCETRNSFSSTLRRLLSGMNTAGRRHSRMSNSPVAVLGEEAQQVLREQDADDFVAVLVRPPESASGRTRSRSGRIFSGGSSRLHHDHLRARHHDVAHLDLGDLQHALEHRRARRRRSGRARAPRASMSVSCSTSAARRRATRRCVAATGRVGPLLSSLMPVVPVASGVGIRIPESAQDFHFEALHAPRWRGALVVVAEQVQRAVHHHVRPVRREGLALLARLARATTGAQITRSPSGRPRPAPRGEAGNDSTLVGLSLPR